MSTFTCDLEKVVETILARSGEEGVPADKAVEILSAAGFEVPGDSPQAKAMSVRALFAWVNPAVAVSKRGPGGGFVRTQYAQPKKKQGTGVISHLNRLREQGLSDDVIRETLAKMAREQGCAV